MTPAELLQSLQWRYATKHFDPTRSIPADAWEALLDSLVLTPSSFGLQPWKFIVVRDPAVRQALRGASWNQPQVTEASELVVFAARTDVEQVDIDRWIDTLASVQGHEREALAPLLGMVEGFVGRMSRSERHAWNVRQTYIALGQFMGAAAALGIDTCPLEGIDPAGYDVDLHLGGTGYATCVACAVGYRSADDHTAERPKARFPREQVIDFR